jgi:hypothetical protein
MAHHHGMRFFFISFGFVFAGLVGFVCGLFG